MEGESGRLYGKEIIEEQEEEKRMLGHDDINTKISHVRLQH